MNNLIESPALPAQYEKTTKELAVGETSESILMRHLNSFLENDLQTLLSDYVADSVLITQDKTFTGIDEIKSFFTNLVQHFPKKKSTFSLDKLVIVNNIAFITWHALTPTVDVPLGTDTFIITNGKIHQQTFAGVLNFLT
jgi:hypothetical protein